MQQHGDNSIDEPDGVSYTTPSMSRRRKAAIAAGHGLLTCLAFLTVAPGGLADSGTTTPPYVDAKTVKAWLDEGRTVLFLDVREPDEFTAGHLPGAVNISHEEVAGLASELPHHEPIVLYCIHSAHRAPEAAKRLRALGFDNAYVLEGGIVAWQAGGLSIRASDLASLPTILPKTDRCAAASP